MNIFTDIGSWRDARRGVTGSLGFVPTMGNLHAGHLDLVYRARKNNDFVAVSIFVNPAQFNDKADFEKYQRTFDADCALLKDAGADFVFHPDAKEIYADDYTLRVTETVIAEELEGAFRPGHFAGMLTVVLKLLNIIAPTRAYFGEKDYQQLLLVQKMCAALFLPLEIVPCPTLRDASGLALSSRNGRLTEGGRAHAALIYKTLMSDMDDAAAKDVLDHAGFRTEYVTTKWGRRLCAAWLGDVRLIDNVPKDPLSPHLRGEG
jgi:pantoate--beta-alanine ligase